MKNWQMSVTSFCPHQPCPHKLAAVSSSSVHILSFPFLPLVGVSLPPTSPSSPLFYGLCDSQSTKGYRLLRMGASTWLHLRPDAYALAM